MYSLMSIRISASSLSNIWRAKVRASSVLPTPVGPRNINVPMGFLGSFKPTLLRCIALTTLLMASACPTTAPFKSSPMWRSLSVSACTMRFTGMPVIMCITSAISSSSIGNRLFLLSSSQSFFAFSSSS